MEEVVEIMLSSLLIVSSLIPGITIRSILSSGGTETITRFAPALMCLLRSTLLRNAPVQSITTSTSNASQVTVPGLPPGMSRVLCSL